ncbi:MAG TPA: hypothetical protein VFF06_27430 [Polyangia bacterium]|nr:hypothetical protein [Polyangia bacterium]
MAVLSALVAACGPKAHPVALPPPPPKPSFAASRVRSFTDTFAVTAVADSGSNLWLGTPRGLLRWELGAGHYTLMTHADGLPADRVAAVAVDAQGGVWVATAKGLSRGLRGSWSNYPPAPVGEFLTGMVPGADGKSAWAAGPEGLAHLHDRRWDRYLPDTGVTALALGAGGVVWVGTSGKGILRLPASGAELEQYGPPQGCEIDVVRGLTVTARGLLAVGEGPSGPRAALFDGDRFYSYAIDSPSVLEWAARSGSHTYLGAGEATFEIVPVTDPLKQQSPPSGPVKLTALVVPFGAAPRTIALKPDLESAALDDPAGAAPRPMPRAPADKNAPQPRGPRLDTAEAGFHLPEGVTAIGASERGLLVGTRFLGALRVENGVPRAFRTLDLATGAERLTVACVKTSANDECYVGTGAARAWRFDGQSFDIAPIDPDPGSRVLAVLNGPRGEVLAIHRGAADPQLRISTVENGNWSPIGMQSVQVPEGVPYLNFAEFSPDGHLWVGLRYVDRDKDQIDHGAAEIALDSGDVVYHRQTAAGKEKVTEGVALPNDVVAMYWRAPHEAWFATRSGAARLLDGKVRVFTENDGMESELITDIGPGPGAEVWVATRRGTGVFDGKSWTFPKMGPFYLKATSLGHDARGHVFLGTDKGLFCVGDCDPEAIDSRRGLLDDSVLDLTVDTRGRVWVLTAKGISVVEP